ncbi:MAG: hypothetical protein GX353_02255 [Oligella ureolytica]|nr:hypothetical protein [Oligella ureolytica]
MLDKLFTKYLDEEIGRNLPDVEKRYRKMFADLGFGAKNQDFIDYWAVYSNEIHDEDGYLVDLAADLDNFDQSLTAALRKEQQLPGQYISFLHSEINDYLFYDMTSDEVYLIDADKLQDFIQTKTYDEKWSNFEEFIKDYLEY